MTQQPAQARVAPTQNVPIAALTAVLRDALSGPANVGADTVIWSDGGSQILLHVGKLQVRVLGSSTLVVAADTESEQFGVVPLIVRFVFGADEGASSLIAATDDQALGHPQIAARWGDLFRDVVWAALTRLVDARSGGQAPAALRLTGDGLLLTFQQPFSAVDLADRHVDDLVARGLRTGRPRAPGAPGAPGVLRRGPA